MPTRGSEIKNSAEIAQLLNVIGSAACMPVGRSNGVVCKMTSPTTEAIYPNEIINAPIIIQRHSRGVNFVTVDTRQNSNAHDAMSCIQLPMPCFKNMKTIEPAAADRKNALKLKGDFWVISVMRLDRGE